MAKLPFLPHNICEICELFSGISAEAKHFCFWPLDNLSAKQTPLREAVYTNTIKRSGDQQA